MGIDVGSVSTNIVLMDEDNNIYYKKIYEDPRKTNRNLKGRY